MGRSSILSMHKQWGGAAPFSEMKPFPMFFPNPAVASHPRESSRAVGNPRSPDSWKKRLITKGSPLGDTLSLSCEASVGTSGSND